MIPALVNPALLRGAAGGGGISSPHDLTGLIGLWDSSVFGSFAFSSGTNATSVADQSGVGNNLTFVNVRPTYNASGFNSRPTMVFDASVGSCFECSSFSMGTGNTLTFFCAINFSGTSVSNGDCGFMGYAALGQSNPYSNVNSWTWDRVSFGDQSRIIRNGSTASPAGILSGNNNRVIGTITSSGVMTLYVNGILTAQGIVSGNWVSGGTFALGRIALTNFANMSGAIPIAGVYTDDHTANVSDLDTYLKTSLGL